MSVMKSAVSSEGVTPAIALKTRAISHSDKPINANEATHKPMVRPDLKLTLSALATDASAA